jgi:NAD(P)-dependent dehydrogenase (short-subunit alcohol dehydrogenase family)
MSGAKTCTSGHWLPCAEAFIAKGWTVGLMARRAEALQEIAAGHANAVPLPCDVTDASAVEASFDQFVKDQGRLDVLFNNAGMSPKPKPIDEVPVEEWLQVVNVNLTGMFLCARQAFKHMRAQGGGRIVNNGSISAHVPRDGSVCYTSTKHAITGMTRTLSLDGRALGIACGQIDIGNAATDMVQALNQHKIDTGQTPDPAMDVQHVADALLYMAELPLNANVQFMTVMATQMAYIGRG